VTAEDKVNNMIFESTTHEVFLKKIVIEIQESEKNKKLLEQYKQIIKNYEKQELKRS